MRHYVSQELVQITRLTCSRVGWDPDNLTPESDLLIIRGEKEVLCIVPTPTEKTKITFVEHLLTHLLFCSESCDWDLNY